MRRQWDAELGEERRAPRQEMAWWQWALRPAVWAPLAAAAIILLLALPLLSPGAGEWPLVPSSAATKGASAGHPLEALANSKWTMQPDFAHSNVVLKAADDTKLTGKLAPAPDLNIFSEKDRLYYRLTAQGQTRGGLAIQASGKLELKGPVVAQTNAAFIPRRRDVESGKLTFTITASNLPPLSITQEIVGREKP